MDKTLTVFGRVLHGFLELCLTASCVTFVPWRHSSHVPLQEFLPDFQLSPASDLDTNVVFVNLVVRRVTPQHGDDSNNEDSNNECLPTPDDIRSVAFCWRGSSVGTLPMFLMASSNFHPQPLICTDIRGSQGRPEDFLPAICSGDTHSQEFCGYSLRQAPLFGGCRPLISNPS